MTYNEAEDLATAYSGVVGKPLLNKLVFVDNRKITSLLISSPAKIRKIFSAWWHNGHNNQEAVTKYKKDKNFEVFLISYNPSHDEVIYYLRLSKYIELGK